MIKRLPAADTPNGLFNLKFQARYLLPFVLYPYEVNISCGN